MASSIKTYYLETDQWVLPVRVAARRGGQVRYRMGRSGAYLQLPRHLEAKRKEEVFRQFEQWVYQVFAQETRWAKIFKRIDYQNGDTLIVGTRKYQIQIKEEERKTNAGKLSNATVLLRLRLGDNPLERKKAIQTLLSRVIGADFLPEITARVHQLNDQHFQQSVNQVRLKYNQSNWGSCSAKRNINLSTRLLFAPPQVVDYVIIHELAHLLEMNHSDRFWQLVRQAMPSYREQEKWLKEYGSDCDF